MGGHEFLKIATATALAINGCFLGKKQNLSHMAAIGTQKVKKWHASLPCLL
jgi:hypothetical protein